ncbi:MAG: hypothetical protein JNM18_15595 [Planctomycetaceae bacterium]|nr:hypothetical protein [Planctomycetaceae bacterium]
MWLARTFLLVVMVGLFATALLSSFEANKNSRARPAEVRVFDDAFKETISIRLDASRNLFQVGFAIAGAIWAIYLTKKDESSLNLAEGEEFGMFVLTNLCFIASFIAHYSYTDRVAVFLESAVTECGETEVPDVFAASVEQLLDSQFWFFCLGCLTSVTVIICGKYLRRNAS